MKIFDNFSRLENHHQLWGTTLTIVKVSKGDLSLIISSILSKFLSRHLEGKDDCLLKDMVWRAFVVVDCECEAVVAPLAVEWSRVVPS